ncbi:MAG TPA: prolyl oligopeptidase family serine peptidase [Streptosporangiaceae bacterium]|nr:prolyl oligopeptidase family serine peptidase [Streptosporangiaceae bacterium]
MLLGDLREYVAIPRVTALRLAPDGSWLAAVVQAVGGEPPKYLSSIWRIDTAGNSEPVRLTRSVEGEASPEFLSDGSLLFASRRPDPGAGKKDAEATKDKPAVWLLPAIGGEAYRIATAGGGVTGLATATGERAFVYAAAVFPGTKDTEQDAARRKARADAGVSAILHEPGGTLRYWDHDLGPESVRLLLPAEVQLSDQRSDGSDASDSSDDRARTAREPRDVTPDPGRALDEQEFDLTPDGSAVVTGWRVTEEGSQFRDEVVVIDASTAQRRSLLSEPGFDFNSPRISPDGELVLAIRAEHDSYDQPGDATLVVTALAAAGQAAASPVSARDLLAGFDRRPLEAVWSPDGRWIYFTADDNGRRPVFRVGVEGGAPVKVTSDDAAYDNLCPAPDSSCLYALRSAIDSPPAPVRIPLRAEAAGAEPSRAEPLPNPGGEVALPGSVTEVATTVADGTRVRGWLVLPEGAGADSPAPLLLWVHGGPVSSWNSWSWRWNPWLMAARGYAVLLPDPALSTGYGHRMIARGWDDWGGNPYTDVMAITDAVLERPDIDAARTAMMGGSYGGYMANWMAGHTDRFNAIVSHAGLWALDQMFGTTDGPPYWRRQFGDPRSQPERYLASSPHLHADKIVTPMLIIHGDKDYRVPVGEALRLWWDLMFRSVRARFLYFPDENHWVLKPGDVQVWYSTVLAFLAEHVLGEEWQRPELL